MRNIYNQTKHENWKRVQNDADPHRHKAMPLTMVLCHDGLFVSAAQIGLFGTTILTPNVISQQQKSYYFVEHLSTAK